MKNQMGLRGKLLSVCVSLSLFTVAVGAVGFFSLRSVVSKYEVVASSNLPNVKVLGEMLGAQRRFRINVTKLGISELTGVQIKGAIKDAEDYVKKYEGLDKS